MKFLYKTSKIYILLIQSDLCLQDENNKQHEVVIVTELLSLTEDLPPLQEKKVVTTNSRVIIIAKYDLIFFISMLLSVRTVIFQ